MDFLAENLKKAIDARYIPAKVGRTWPLSEAKTFRSVPLGEALQPQCVQVSGICLVQPCIEPKGGATIKFTDKMHTFDPLTGITTDGR